MVEHAYIVHSYYAGCDSSEVHDIQHHGQCPIPLEEDGLSPELGWAFSA